MKNKKEELLAKLDKLVSPQPSAWFEQTKERETTKGWRKNSQKIAVKILRELRVKGLKQTQLAKMLKVTPQQVSKWVKGKENFTLETLDKIGNALEINLLESLSTTSKLRRGKKFSGNAKHPYGSIQVNREYSKKVQVSKEVKVFVLSTSRFSNYQAKNYA